MQQIRRRVLWVVVGVAGTAVGVISLTTLPAWPIVGVAVAAVVVAVNGITSRLKTPICYGCAHDLTGIEAGEHGAICPGCGVVTPPTGPRRA